MGLFNQKFSKKVIITNSKDLSFPLSDGESKLSGSELRGDANDFVVRLQRYSHLC